MNLKSTQNKFVLHFTRYFTGGTLEGMTLPDSIPFLSRSLAASWVRGIRRNSRAGKLNYKLVNVSGWWTRRNP